MCRGEFELFCFIDFRSGLGVLTPGFTKLFGFEESMTGDFDLGIDFLD